MKNFGYIVSVVLGVVPTVVAVAATSDIPAPAKRREAMLAATSVSEISKVADLPADLTHPFNPVAFGQPDADELKAIAAAQAAEAAAANKSKPANDAELLERIAERVVPSGTLTMNGEPLLIFAQKRVRVGDRLTVTFDGRDYIVEISSIQRFTFTLRLNRAEVTRRINPGKNP
jgi:hypothetical protein